MGEGADLALCEQNELIEEGSMAHFDSSVGYKLGP